MDFLSLLPPLFTLSIFFLFLWDVADEDEVVAVADKGGDPDPGD